jgi:hypothetical protein
MINEFIDEHRSEYDIENNIHLIWYAIGAGTARITQGDREIIKGLCNFIGTQKKCYICAY